MHDKGSAELVCQFFEDHRGRIKHRNNQKMFSEILAEINELCDFFSKYEIDIKINARSNFRELEKKLNWFFQKAEKVEKVINDEILIRKIKKLFRQAIKNYMFKSSLLKRGYLKPRGYPGDFKIIEAMYNNVSISSGIGKDLDRYFLNTDYVKAVRDRKDSMKLFLREYLSNQVCPEINILNLACGSCREIREILDGGFTVKKNVNFILVDQDEKCLSFARKNLNKYQGRVRFNFIQADVVEFLRNPNLFLKSIKLQHLIYSIGLIDYLPSSILGPFFKRGTNLLDKGGKFVVAHKNTRVFSSPISDWGADWKFIPRNQVELKKIILNNIDRDSYALDFFFKKSRLIFFINILRNI